MLGAMRCRQLRRRTPTAMQMALSAAAGPVVRPDQQAISGGCPDRHRSVDLAQLAPNHRLRLGGTISPRAVRASTLRRDPSPAAAHYRTLTTHGFSRTLMARRSSIAR